MKKLKIAIWTLIVIGIIGGSTALLVHPKLDNKNDESVKSKKDIDIDSENDYGEEDSSKIEEDILKNDTIQIPKEEDGQSETKLSGGSLFYKKDNSLKNSNEKKNEVIIEVPSLSGNGEKPEEPSEIIKPIEPSIPGEEVIDDLIITKDMIKNGLYRISDKKFKTITIADGINENTKIVLNNVEIEEDLILVDPSKYQLDVNNSSMNTMIVMNKPVQFFSMAFRVLEKFNRALDGATVNFQNDSVVNSIVINSNIEINGTNLVSNIDVFNAPEVVLNIPSEKLSIDTKGTVVINEEIDVLENVKDGAKINLNASVNTFTNESSSVIRISEGNVINNFYNIGENTTVSGNGSIINAQIEANNTRIYSSVTNNVKASENIDYLIRQENDIKILNVVSKAQGSVTFTLSEVVNLTLKDISVICQAGKSINLFNLYTDDNMTYTLTTNYFKNDAYELYITLPNGNIISKSFGTDYANPTVGDVVLERNSDSEATLKLYGVDEGGYLYYILEEVDSRISYEASLIKEKGKSERLKVGFNSVGIKELDPGKTYNLYYVIEGYFENVSSVKGPFVIENQVKEDNPSKYTIEYAKEEVSNHFVFKLNKIPEKELTLNDFEIHCPSDSSLTIKDATFFASPDLLTYIIDIPSNYGHKDNEYTVKIKVAENEIIEKDFVTHMNPPVITGAVDGVIRDSLNSVQFTFNSDEPGEVYYGVYEWNGGIYDYNSTTPFASDVITGKIKSNKQKLNAGSNKIDIDLSNVNVTKYTRVWALFVDEVGNYRVGFVDHYKIPEFVEPNPPVSDSTLKITNFNYTNNTIEVEFNEELYYNIISDDIDLSVAGSGSLPSKLLYIIDNDDPKKVKIKIQNYTLPTGVYKLTLNVTDKNEKNVKLEEKIEIK